MVLSNFESAVRSTFVYSYAISQPLAAYFVGIPFQQNEVLFEQSPLQLGDSGEVVRLIQTKLNYLGYYDDLIDGEYGLLTQYALKQFQSSHNITITGTTDKQTMTKLIQEETEEYLKEINEIIPQINFGEENESVISLQEKLAYLGYYNGNVDGIYGSITDEAINKMYMEQSDYYYNINESIQTTINDSQQEEQNSIEIKTLSYKVHTEQNNSNIIDIAQSYIGTPYVWGGQSPNGFDCSGFIQYVFSEQNKTIPRTVNEIWNFSQPIDSPSIGDLVFFETYKPGPSHMGIYLGNGEFIHAGSSRGVEISNLENTYWKANYLGAKRVN